MPKATTKTKHYNQQDKPNSFFDTVLDNFIKTGFFKLTNEIVTIELLSYFINYLNLNKPARFSYGLDYRFYLDNVTFDLGVQNLPVDRLEMPIHIFLDKVFSCSPRWNVIGFNNVSILQGEVYSPLSSYFILVFLARFAPLEDGSIELAITKALIITNAEFHQWAWMRFLTKRPTFWQLTLELLPNEDETDNIMVLGQALHYAKIQAVNLGNTNISAEGYQNLYELLSKNYFIEKLQIKEPTDPESLVIFKKIKECLSEDRTGKQRFDVERFNQTEFLRLFSQAKNARQHETDESEISRLEKEIKFILEEKKRKSITISKERFPLKCELIPEAHAVYYDHAEYILGRLPLFRLDLNQSVPNQTSTLGYCLLEEALRNNDHFMMNCLLDNGNANLFEQQGEEKPILIQIYENEDFKHAILKHISYRKTLVSMAEQILQNYPESEKIMVDMANSLTNYPKRLEKIIYSHKLSDFERLLNQLKERYNLSRPSKERDQEFIEIYWRVGKSLIQFHNAGKVTVQSISNAQSTQNEITAISKNADLGWLHGSKLHYKLTRRLDLLKKDMSKNIKKLSSELSELDEPGPSTRFSPRH